MGKSEACHIRLLRSVYIPSEVLSCSAYAVAFDVSHLAVHTHIGYLISRLDLFEMTTDENTPLLSSQEAWKTSDAPSHDIDEEKQRRSNLLTIYMGFLGTDLGLDSQLPDAFYC